MLNVSGVAINFDGQNLFSNVNLQFLPGNCYGIIGANGAGKSTFLRILSGDLEPSKGDVSFDPKYRMSVLKQDHFAYESHTIFDTIMQGNARQKHLDLLGLVQRAHRTVHAAAVEAEALHQLRGLGFGVPAV